MLQWDVLGLDLGPSSFDPNRARSTFFGLSVVGSPNGSRRRRTREREPQRRTWAGGERGGRDAG